MLKGNRQNVQKKITATSSGVLLLNSSMQMSYNTLRRWIESRTDISYVRVYEQQNVDTIRQWLAPRMVQAIAGHRDTIASRIVLNNFTLSFGQYKFIIVLCLNDEDVMTGRTVYRVLAEALLSADIVLVGPTAIRIWPGGRKTPFYPKRMRELLILGVTSTLGLGTAGIALTMVALQEVLVRRRLLK